jgi:hypothetical protein
MKKLLNYTIILSLSLVVFGCGDKIQFDENDYIGVYKNRVDSITINKDFSFVEVNEGVTKKGDWKAILSYERVDSTDNFIQLNYKDGVTKEWLLQTKRDKIKGCKSFYVNREISDFYDAGGGLYSGNGGYSKKIVVEELNYNFIDEGFSTEIWAPDGYIGSGYLKITYDRIKNSGKYSLQFDFSSEVKNSSSYNYYFKPLEIGITGIIRDDSLYRNESFVNFPLNQFGGRIHIDTICCKHTVNYSAFKSYDFFNNIKFR